MINIAVDAGGGDFGPMNTVYGSCLALAENPNLTCLFFGNPIEIEKAIPDFTDRNQVQIMATSEEITDADHPLMAVRKKQDASIVKGLQAVATGKADAFVSAGSSGAIYAGGLSIIGTIPEVKRPAAVTILPTVSKTTPAYLLIDSGANIASKPEHLVTYGKIGSKLIEQLYGKSTARVGLLNIGTEANKGNAFAKETFQLLTADKDLHFTGNVEPSVLLHGTHDVILTDGFTGNIMLKTVEGTAGILLKDVLHEMKNKINLPSNIEDSLEELIQAKIDRYTNEDIGGGFILGIKAPVIITHGAASRKMFQHSVELAAKLAKSDVFTS